MGCEELQQEGNRWISDMIWSEPVEDSKCFGRGSLNSHFAHDVTRSFCSQNGLGLIVRCRASLAGNNGFDIMHDQLLLRVSSARDCMTNGNDGATVLVTQLDAEDG